MQKVGRGRRVSPLVQRERMLTRKSPRRMSIQKRSMKKVGLFKPSAWRAQGGGVNMMSCFHWRTDFSVVRVH